MMQAPFLGITADREEIIRAACATLVRELRLIDPLTFANFFHFAQSQQTYDEINAIVLRNFPSGKVIFGCSGDALIGWGMEPVVAIDLELNDQDVSAFFRLVITKSAEKVELHHISFSPDDSGMAPPADVNNKRLAATLEKAGKPA